MGPFSSTSEIIETSKDMNDSHSSKGLNLSARNSNSRVADIVAKHLLPILARDCSMETDLNQLLEAIDLRNPSRDIRAANQSGATPLRKNAMKKPIRVGISQASGIGVAESGTLKQALRGLCISQASEMATQKRLSKPAGLSGVSEAGTIKKLYRTVVVQAGESGPSSDAINGVGSSPGKGSFMEISLVPESGTSDLLEQMPDSLQTGKVDLSNEKAVSPRHCAVSPAPEIIKTLPQDERVPVSREVVNKPSKSNLRIKVKPNSAPLISGSSGTSFEVMKSDVGHRVSRMICKNKKYSKRKGQQESPSLSSSSNMCSDTDSGVSGRGSSILDNRYKTIGMKTSESLISREKGECSHSSKSSIGEYSSSSGLSGESNLSSSSCNGNRPHMSKDLRWEAIHQVEIQQGSLGLSHFNLLKRIGCGDIANVYLAELRDTKCQFALKVMDNEFLESRKKKLRAQTEKEILQMLDHPFLPTLYHHFTTDKLSCLVMEFCPGGDLHLLRQRQSGRSFSEQAARFYATEVLLALEYLHMMGVVYRDLKPENVLVREDGHIMLSDFDLSLRCSVNPTLLKSSSSGIKSAKKLSGMCSENSCINPPCLQPWVLPMPCFTPRLVSLKARKPKSDRTILVPELVAEPVEARSNSFVGTHEYLAPEIIRGEGHGSAVDWWTFGIFLYELLYGRTPFKGSGNEETLSNVVSQCLKFPENPYVSFPARDLIRGLLIKEPENRLGSLKGAVEIKQHPFFEGLNWALVRCATPPETPKVANEVGNPAGACRKKENKCLEFRSAGEDIKFELF